MKNRTVIVALAAINAVSKNIVPKIGSHGAWGYTMPIPFDDLADELLLQIDERVRNHVSKVIVCSAQGDSYGKDSMFDLEKGQHKKRARPAIALATTDTGLVSRVNAQLPIVDDVFKIDAACASGIKGLEVGMLMAANTDELVMVLGVEYATAPYIAFSFGSIFATCQSGNYLGPFDSNRTGFALGDGAGSIVICNEDTARKLNLPIKAYLDSINFLTLPSDQPSQPSNLTALTKFLADTLVKSNRQKTEFAFWDAHATATTIGDQVEYELFSSSGLDVPISSFKGAIGHCLSASAIIEIVNAVEHLQKGIIPMNHRVETRMTQDDRIILSNETTNKKTFIKCSFGFGGRNGAAVITVV